MRVYRGVIYKEIHNKGNRRKPGVGGIKLVRGVGYVRSTQYRWVAEITYHGKRYRCRSYYYERVWRWLEAMRQKFNKLNTAGTAEIKACGDMAGGYSGQPTKPRNL